MSFRKPNQPFSAFVVADERKISQILESVRSSAKYVDAILADQQGALAVLSGLE